ncbi:MAG: winged helix-turn-helix transcriptional regulator [Halobacteriaceae archaeon]
MPDDGVDEQKRTTLRRFATLGAITPLASIDTDTTKTFTSLEEKSLARDAITGYLSLAPGVHFSKIRDDLQLGTGETQYHLKQLTDDNIIESYRDGEYRRFYPSGRFTTFQKVTLAHLRKQTARQLIIELLKNPNLSGRELAEKLDVSEATISKTAKSLESADILTRNNGYTLTEPETILVLLLRYAESFDEVTSQFASTARSLIEYSPD